MAKLNPGRIAVREALQALLDNEERIETHEAVQHVLAQLSPSHRNLIVEDAVTRLVQSDLHTLVKAGRDEGRKSIIDWDKLDAKPIAARIFEHIGGDTYRAMIAFTRPDARAAAEERMKQAAGHMPWIGWHNDTAKVLPNDTISIGNHLSDQQFNTLWRKHFQPRTPGDPIPGV